MGTGPDRRLGMRPSWRPPGSLTTLGGPVIVELEPTEYPGLCTVLAGRYLVRFDALACRFRWALAAYPDDGVGVRTHGASPTLRGAIRECIENDRERRAL